MRRRAVLACCLLLATAGFLAVETLISPEIPFLRPGFQGVWIAHPDPPIEFHPHGDSPCPEMIFRHRFRADSRERLPIRVTASQSFSLTVNGAVVHHRPPATWKRWTALDLGPYLRRCWSKAHRKPAPAPGGRSAWGLTSRRRGRRSRLSRANGTWPTAPIRSAGRRSSRSIWRG